MTREKRLEYCSICLNRKMNLQKGLLCGLTDDYAKFEDSCADFKEDFEEKKKKLIRDLDASGHQDASGSLDHKKNKETGAIVFFIGVAILLVTLVNVDSYGILVIPFGAILYGARTYNKGIEQEKVLNKRDSFDERINQSQ